jgi:hypothetical protein
MTEDEKRMQGLLKAARMPSEATQAREGFDFDATYAAMTPEQRAEYDQKTTRINELDATAEAWPPNNQQSHSSTNEGGSK